MNLIETGKLIAKLRKEAGYTQASLANKLHITDKAVSKWERGLSVPDTTLLPKLCRLLDQDMEFLIGTNTDYHNHNWKGLLILDNKTISCNKIVHDKPLIYYLLSYFLLVGITNIEIKTNDKKYINSLNLKKHGINISYDLLPKAPTLIVHNNVLLFGANLTRTFRNIMDSNKTQKLKIDNRELPIIFNPSGDNNYNIDHLRDIAEERKLGRGMVGLLMNNRKQLNDASEFVRIYQVNHEKKIADIEEVTKNRNI